MRRCSAAVQVSDEERRVLDEWLRRGKTERRLAERAKIVLPAHEGRSNEQIAEQRDTRTARVSKWCRRFGKDRIAGLTAARQLRCRGPWSLPANARRLIPGPGSATCSRASPLIPSTGSTNSCHIGGPWSIGKLSQ